MHARAPDAEARQVVPALDDVVGRVADDDSADPDAVGDEGHGALLRVAELAHLALQRHVHHTVPQ